MSLTVGDRNVGTTAADGAGRFETPLVLPDLPVGHYQVVARCGPVLSTHLDLVLVSRVDPATSTMIVLVFFVLAGLALLRRQLIADAIRPRWSPLMYGSRSGRGSGLARRVVVALAVGLGLTGAWAVLAPTAVAAPAVTLHASVDGRAVAEGTERHPLRLEPDHPTVLVLTVGNDGDQPVSVNAVRLSGQVLGLTFFAYDTSVRFDVDAHQTVERRFELELSDLDGQAVGLIPSEVAVLDGSRRVLATQQFVADVRGGLRSVYGVFGVAVAVLSALWFLGALWALARGRLSVNRWRRALRFLTPGLGLGLTLVFTLSALRVLAPLPSRWVPMVAGSAAVLFGAGYLTPSPDTEADDDLEGDVEVDDAVGEADDADRTTSGADSSTNGPWS